MNLPDRTPPLPRTKPWTIPASFTSPFTTPRLTLRPTRSDDALRLNELTVRSQDHLARFLPWAEGKPQSLQNTQDFIALNKPFLEASEDTDPNTLGGFNTYHWVIVWNESSKPIGIISFNYIDVAANLFEIGYWLDTNYSNKGIMTEAVAHFVTKAFTHPDKDGWGFNRCFIQHAASNTASGAIPRKLGFRREAWYRQHMVIGDKRRDDKIGWGLLREEWDFTNNRSTRNIPAPPQGVGPHPKPWPTDAIYDPHLLAGGDSRNVVDKYRYWTMDAIREDMRKHNNPFHVAVENWQHDMNIGTVVRNANAFGAAGVHIVGRRTWNKRGAMVTDRYLDVYYHDTVEDLQSWCTQYQLDLVGIDLIPGSQSIVTSPIPRNAMLLFGQEGPGLTQEALALCTQVLHLPQVGSTRSINAGVASGAAMVMWLSQHRPLL